MAAETTELAMHGTRYVAGVMKDGSTQVPPGAKMLLGTHGQALTFWV